MFSKYETLLKRTMCANFILFQITPIPPTSQSYQMCFVKDYRQYQLSSVTVQFLQSLYVTLVNYLGSINGTPIIQKPSTMYCLS